MIFSVNKDVVSIIVFAKDNYKIQEAIISFLDPRHLNLGQKILLKNKDLKKIKNINEDNFEKYKEILMKNLVPYTPDDLKENKSLLLENNFQNINAIDWDKGCYVGQEITARMKYRSLLKKQLYTLEIISGEIKIGDEIIINKIIFGKVISKVNKYILCILKIDLVSEKK